MITSLFPPPGKVSIKGYQSGLLEVQVKYKVALPVPAPLPCRLGLLAQPQGLSPHGMALPLPLPFLGPGLACWGRGVASGSFIICARNSELYVSFCCRFIVSVYRFDNLSFLFSFF